MFDHLEATVKHLEFSFDGRYNNMSFQVKSENNANVSSHAASRILPYHLYVDDGEPIEFKPNEVYDIIGDRTVLLMVTGEGQQQVVHVQYRPDPDAYSGESEQVAAASHLATVPSLLFKHNVIRKQECEQFVKKLSAHFDVSESEVTHAASLSSNAGIAEEGAKLRCVKYEEGGRDKTAFLALTDTEYSRLIETGNMAAHANSVVLTVDGHAPSDSDFATAEERMHALSRPKKVAIPRPGF